MLISIIIPVYNVEAYLADCLDSVFNQFFDCCEVITVNDGSTDNSRQILSEYQRRYPELLIVDQENKGLSGARNAGMRNAKGEYLYFLDSDDFLLPGAVTEIVQSIKMNDAEVIGFNAMANSETVYIPSFKVGDASKTGVDFFVDFYRDNGFYPYLNVWLYVYKKSFLECNNLIFKEGHYHEDVLFSMYVFFYATKIRGFNIPIYNYRQHRDGSICTNIKLKNLTDKSIICRELDSFYRAFEFENVFFYNTIFYTYLYTISQGISNGYHAQRKQFFYKEDIDIMKKGIINDYEFKLWFLAKININIMIAYYDERLPNWLRRFVNVFFSKMRTYL